MTLESAKDLEAQLQRCMAGSTWPEFVQNWTLLWELYAVAQGDVLARQLALSMSVNRLRLIKTKQDGEPDDG